MFTLKDFPRTKRDRRCRCIQSTIKEPNTIHYSKDDSQTLCTLPEHYFSVVLAERVVKIPHICHVWH